MYRLFQTRFLLFKMRSRWLYHQHSPWHSPRTCQHRFNAWTPRQPALQDLSWGRPTMSMKPPHGNRPPRSMNTWTEREQSVTGARASGRKHPARHGWSECSTHSLCAQSERWSVRANITPRSHKGFARVRRNTGSEGAPATFRRRPFRPPIVCRLCESLHSTPHRHTTSLIVRVDTLVCMWALPHARRPRGLADMAHIAFVPINTEVPYTACVCVCVCVCVYTYI